MNGSHDFITVLIRGHDACQRQHLIITGTAGFSLDTHMVFMFTATVRMRAAGTLQTMMFRMNILTFIAIDKSHDKTVPASATSMHIKANDTHQVPD